MFDLSCARRPGLMLMAALLFVPVAPAAAQETARATLTVVGAGEARAVPDMATLSSGVVASAKTAEEALAGNSKVMADLVAAVRAAGVEQRDIATSAFSIQPQYSQPPQNSREAPRVVGYEVRNTVTVTVRDLALLGGLVDRMVAAGANQAGALRYGVSEPGALEEKARLTALNDAMAQAKALAAGAGMRLTRLRRIAPAESGGASPSPMLMKAEARGVPFEAGETVVEARVSLVYEIEPL
ncbi:SIMPL domain-containing protein [Aquabacter spiritensis]|uniref:SIMPL domain-containing protein n=1 Tax=Aquabacter spiritensis TaxID=933073 RepID=A0A4R3LVH6_9HYPH|nr:SIMPL domain-containing protein [Aquabacter spiritensis]TCT02685.1 hypothetical protein EDC64_112121 [Aquabacter spiritensis]